MKRLLITTLLVALTVVGVALAQEGPKPPDNNGGSKVKVTKPKPTKPAGCVTLYTINNYRYYASRVYRRNTISAKAQRTLARMEKCQHSAQARKVVARYHKRYLREREWRHRGSFRGIFHSTAYGPPWGGIEGGGTTATGWDLPDGPTSNPMYIIAIDDGVLGPGSGLHMGGRYHIWPNPYGYKGCWNAQDRGGAIVGYRLDFLVLTGRAHQNGWGRRSVRLYNCRR